MFTNNKLAKSVRLAIAFGAAATALPATQAFAQEEGAEEVERIAVTGSRLKRTDLETAQPITTITAEQMEAQGIQDVGQFLQSSAIMSGSPAMTTTNNGGSGGTFVELRGLGSSRTLVLVNGRRPVSSDFQGIPSSMIKRIDVLKDGASATYGADAVAGVVNIVTKKDFEGAQVNLNMSGSSDVDTNNQHGFSVLLGKNFDGGNVVFGVDYVDQEAVYQGDTPIDYMNFPWQVWGTAAEESFRNNGLIGTGDDANVIVLGSGSVPCGQFYFADGTPNQTNGTCDGGIATLSDMRDFVGGGANNDTYNYAPVNFLQTPYEKLNFFVETNFELNDDTRAYTETRINKRTSRQELAAVPYDTNFGPAYNGITTDTADGSPQEFTGVSKDNFYNPFGKDVTRSRRRMLEGGRFFEQDISRFQQVVGIEGDIGDYYYDVNYNYGYAQTISTDFGQLYGPNLAKAMGPSFQNDAGDIVCGTVDAPIPGCVSMNVFGGPGSVTDEMLDYVSAPLVDYFTYTVQTLTGFIGGDVFELPAGFVSGGVGFEYRSEEAEGQVDSGKFMGEVTGNTGRVTGGDFDVTSVFAEFSLPLIEDMPLVESLTMPIGVRYDDHSVFGGAETYQVGIEWQTGLDLLIRANMGTSFRAPGIGNLFAPASDSFPSATDPCRAADWSTLTSAQQGFCMADGVPTGGTNNNDGQQLARVGGNADLQPEEGETLTIGFAWSPEFIEGLGITVDYWSIDIDGVIDAVGAADSLKGCYYGGIAELCNNVNRKSNGELDYITATVTNLSRKTATGIDFEASYNLEVGEGELSAIFSMTHFLERQDQVYNAETFSFEMEELKGQFAEGADTSYPEDKWNLGLSYSLDNLTVSYTGNFIGMQQYQDLLYWGVTEINDAGDVAQYEVEEYMYHDISASYSFDFGTTIAVGVTNLTDEQPPYIEPAFNGNTDESTYRLFGQSYFARLTHNF
jgi:outer membrane receptor protein involved in Fe transport